jgi:hypothetical protein
MNTATALGASYGAAATGGSRKWLGGAGGAIGGSMKKVGSALGLQKQSALT